jgi:hypothetical protein
MGGTYGVRSNVKKNRMYIDLYGAISLAEVHEVARAISVEAGKLGPRFDVVTDISSCRVGDSAIAAKFEEIQEQLAARGMRHVVRVVGESIRTMLLLWRLSNEMGYAADTAVSLAEADTILDERQAGRRARPPAGETRGCPRCGYPGTRWRRPRRGRPALLEPLPEPRRPAPLEPARSRVTRQG